MAVNAYDVQVCLRKILKLSWKTCVTFSIKYPVVSFSLLCLFLLYMSFPLVFWVLIYSFPLLVCTCIILSISFSLGNGNKYKDEGEEENDGKYSRKTKFVADDSVDDKNKKSFTRVHSVRQRRAKDIRREDNMQYNVEEKTAVSPTNFTNDMVDKNALIEEIPKDIREVEVDYSLVNSAKSTSSSASQSLKHKFDEGTFRTESLEGLKDEEEARDDGNKATKGNKDGQKNVMDVGISDIERNKRLESLIARRRSRKLLSLQVRRTLMNMDRNDQPDQIASIVNIPKNNNTSFLPSNVVASQFSPGPGSAPSVLIPMRNPFDLPYDPQEEKPDLTGDSFQQEFLSANNRDMMFCRHESFSLGAFLPGEFNQNREKTSLVHDVGFRQRASSLGYQFSNQGNEFGREFAPIMEQESYEVSESKSNIDSPGDDHIKEIIQVYENGIHNHGEEEDTDEVQTRPIPEEYFNYSSSSPSSSEEDAPIFKIDKEAILKSLSSMARRNDVEETENNEQIGDHLSYPFENSDARLKAQFCYADKTMRHHTPSYSIASDLQVEVSEVSSPPLSMDENLSYHGEDISPYDGDMEKKITSDSEVSWAGSSHLDLSQVDENESRSQVNEVSEQDIIKVGFSRINKPEDTALSNSMEEPLDQKNWIHSCSSNAELCDSGQAHAANLHEEIHETFQTPVSSVTLHENKQQSRWNLVPHSSHGNDSGKPAESSNASNKSKRALNIIHDVHGSKILQDNIYQIKQSTTIKSKTGEQIVGQLKKFDECHDMEHLAAESIQSSEDSEERLKPKEEMVKESTIVENHFNLEPVQHSEDEQSSAEVTITQTTVGSNDPQAPSLIPNVAVEHVQISSISPKSVLLLAFSLDQGSLSSFDQDIDEEVQQFGAHIAEVSSPVAFQNSTALPCFDGDVEVLLELSEPSKTSALEADDTESLNKQKIHENGIKLKEVASGSSQTLDSHEAPAEPTEETSSRSLNNNDEVSSKNFEASNPTAFSEDADHTDNSNSSL